MQQTNTLSPTLQQVGKQLYEQKVVYAHDIVNLLFKKHPEYIQGAKSKKFSPNKQSRVQPWEVWLENLRSLFNPEEVLLD